MIEGIDRYGEVGDFLVRAVASEPNCYGLSVKTSPGNSKSANFLIERVAVRPGWIYTCLSPFDLLEISLLQALATRLRAMGSGAVGGSLLLRTSSNPPPYSLVLLGQYGYRLRKETSGKCWPTVSALVEFYAESVSPIIGVPLKLRSTGDLVSIFTPQHRHRCV